MIGAVVLGLVVVAVAGAHDLFLISKGSHVLVIFNHDLEPDPNVGEATWKRFEGLKLTGRQNGKTTPLTATKEKDHYKVAVPAGDLVVAGHVAYVSPGKGDAKLVARSVYPKVIVGAIPADGGALGADCPLEIVPKVEGGKVRFQVLAAGKPVAGAQLAVIIAEKGEEAAATTDESGWSPSFEAKGRYGVAARRVEEKAGELNGMKYESMTTIATLVVDVK
jgi:hypothetical protein